MNIGSCGFKIVKKIKK